MLFQDRGRIRATGVLICLLFLLMLPAGATAETSPWSLRASLGYGEFTKEMSADSAGLNHLTNPSSDPAINALGSLAAIESLGRRREEVQENHVRLGMEYLIGDLQSFGLTFGLSYESSTAHCLQNCGQYNTIYSLALASSGSATGQIAGASSLAFQTVLPVLEQVLRPTDYSYLMLDLGLNWYFLKTESWKPYLGMGLGLGKCIGDYDCEALKIAPRLGSRYVISPNLYAFAELEYQTKVFSNRDAGIRILSEPVISPALHIGMGWNL
ncbi:MAG: hypothetical protein KDK25_13055 [Leptospiraceae bacterium]|nr:hypothetical protein [Leptospiraceae bacterium]